MVLTTIIFTVLKDALRKKVLYFLALFALVLIAFSPLLPSYGFGVQLIFIKDIALSSLTLFSIIITVYLSITQLPTEIEKKTIYNIISKPVSRTRFILGKYLGIVLTIFIIILILTLGIQIYLILKGGQIEIDFLKGVFAIFLENAVIASVAVLFSTFCSPPLNVFLIILFYVLGHAKIGIIYTYLIHYPPLYLKPITYLIYYIIPNLENFGLQSHIVFQAKIPLIYLLDIFLYALLYTGGFLLITTFIFRKKDL